jgi:hypothetical protein
VEADVQPDGEVDPSTSVKNNLTTAAEMAGSDFVSTTLAFLVVSLTSASYLHQLRFANGESTRQRASEMAESVTNLAVIYFQADPTFGTPGHADYSKVYSYSRDGCEALLTFDPVKANDLGIKVSTNNFQGGNAVPGGAGRDVPPGQVELLGHATYHNTTTEIRHLIGVPDFSFVLATNGTFESNGTLLVGELPEGADPATVNLDDLLPGHLGAGGDVKLSGTADILGNVQSGNNVETSGNINIRGEVYGNRPMPDLPVVDIDRYRTETPFSGNLPSGATTSQTIGQHTLVDGDLTVSGTLELSDAILFVDGNLECPPRSTVISVGGRSRMLRIVSWPHSN